MKSNKKIRRPGRRMLGIAALGVVAVLVTLVLVVVTAVNNETSAKGKPKDKDKGTGLTLVSVTSPTVFNGVAPYPTRVQPGQKLVAVTVDFDRDFKNHLRSSEDGEVYLSGADSQQVYYTVDTAVPKSDGPGKKPVRQATFVFSVPVGTQALTFHYGTQATVPLPQV